MAFIAPHLHALVCAVYYALRSPLRPEVPMPPGPVSESCSARRPFRPKNASAVGPFALEGGKIGETFLEINGASVGTHARLRKLRDVVCQILRRLARVPARHNLFTEADAQALLGL